MLKLSDDNLIPFEIGDRLYDPELNDYGTIIDEVTYPGARTKGDSFFFHAKMDRFGDVLVYFPNNPKIRHFPMGLYNMFNMDPSSP